MASPFAASLIHALLAWRPGTGPGDAGNRVSIEGVDWTPGERGELKLAIRKLEAAGLRLASGPLVLEMGRLVVHDLAVRLQAEGEAARLHSAAAAGAEVTGLKLHGPLSPSAARHAGSSGPWTLEPLAAADGTLRAEIIDAHLLFDAQVTVPLRHGEVRFNDATVEHVGPDSRMGVSRLGIYVDAPNGRSYLYQFPSAPVAGVAFERRGALLTPWVSDRGKLQLQPFAQALLRQPPAGPSGLTEQARLLFERTAVSGQVQPGDGRLEGPGFRARMTGRDEGRNAVQVHSQAVGRGLTAQVPALSLAEATLAGLGIELGSEAITADLTLRLASEGGQLRFELGLQAAKLSSLRLQDVRPAGS